MSQIVLQETFNASSLHPELTWLNEPPIWRLDTAQSRLRIETAERTDFWQRSHYGFQADYGHFLGAPLSGDFVMEPKVRFHPKHQYDQAGLMIRFEADHWIKTSVEFEPEGLCYLGAVVTNLGFSDWSVQEFPGEIRETVLQIRKRSSDYEIYYGSPENRWKLLRIAHLHYNNPLSLRGGIYACSPKENGFVAEFEYLRVTTPQERP
jgi:regulation of enolase protein 1 (concanavalin A-like superfamily)